MKPSHITSTILSQIRYALFGFHSSVRYKIGYWYASIGKMWDIIRGKSIKNRFPFSGTYTIANMYGNFEILEPSDMHGILSPFSEWELHAEFLSAKRGVFLDIGANIGKYSIFLASKHEKVISVEANPQVVKFLQKNTAINNIKNIAIFPKGIGIPGKSTISIPEGNNFGSGSLDQAVLRDPVQETYECEVVAFSDLVHQIWLQVADIRLIKIDTEWSEEEIIHSMKPFFTDMHDVKMIVEIWDDQKRYNITAMLEAVGFTLKSQYWDNSVFVKP